ARTYDAIVDFIAQIPEDDEGIVEGAIRFHRAMDRTVERGMDRAGLRLAATWAVAVHDMLEALAREYGAEPDDDPEHRLRQRGRAVSLLDRARYAADRIATESGVASAGELVDAMERLTYAIRYRGVAPHDAEPLLRAAQRQA